MAIGATPRITSPPGIAWINPKGSPLPPRRGAGPVNDLNRTEVVLRHLLGHQAARQLLSLLAVEAARIDARGHLARLDHEGLVGDPLEQLDHLQRILERLLHLDVEPAIYAVGDEVARHDKEEEGRQE